MNSLTSDWHATLFYSLALGFFLDGLLRVLSGPLAAGHVALNLSGGIWQASSTEVFIFFSGLAVTF